MRTATIGLFLASVTAVGCARDPSAWRSCTDSHTAYIMMQDFVERRLRSPKSAEFPNPLIGPHQHVKHIGDHTYLIDSWVDADNAFSASIRTRFVGKVRQVSDDEWHLVELNFRD